MKFLITGGAGFVGSNLAFHLSEEGHEVVCLDNLVRRGSEFNISELKEKGIKMIHGDIRNPEDLVPVEQFKPDVVLECAAQPSAIDGYANPMYDITNNTYGLVNVLEYCRKVDAGLIFWSTNKVYSGKLCNSVPFWEDKTRLRWKDPGNSISATTVLPGWSMNGFNEALDVNGGDHSIYGVSKLASDVICQEWSDSFDIPVIINRFSCLYGPRQFGKVAQGWMVWFVIAKLLGEPLAFYGFNGKQVRDYLHVQDLGDLILKQSKAIDGHRGSYYNVGGGIENTISLRELDDLLIQLMKIESPIGTGPERRADQRIYISDIGRVCNEFDWKPKVPLAWGLTSCLGWAKKNLHDLRKIY